MGFYSETVVPRLVTCACGTKPILKQREKIVPRPLVEYWKSVWVRDITCRITDRSKFRNCGHRSLLDQLKLAQPRAAELGVPLPLSKGRLRKCHYLMETLKR